MANQSNPLSTTRRMLAMTGQRLNAFGQPFYGSKIKGVQRKTYMGGGDQGPLSSRPTQATGTKGVEIELARREQQSLVDAATRGAERARNELAPKPVVPAAPNSVKLKPTDVPAAKAKNPAPKPATPEAGMTRGFDLINAALPKGMKPVKPQTTTGAALREMRRKQGGLVLRSPQARSYAV